MDGNNYITWASLIGVTIGVISLIVRTRPGYVSKEVFIQFEKRMETQYESINKNIGFLREDIKSLKK